MSSFPITGSRNPNNGMNPSRKQYRKPVLEKLGDLRTMTLGGSPVLETAQLVGIRNFPSQGIPSLLSRCRMNLNHRKTPIILLYKHVSFHAHLSRRRAGNYFSHAVIGIGTLCCSRIKAEIFPFKGDSKTELISQVTGLVGNEMRRVEVWSGAFGYLLKVAGGGDVCISPGGDSILRVDGTVETTSLDRDILLGPALVLALALRGVWSLHASASMFRDHLVMFLGKSGQGKSTLASYLAGSGGGDWRWVADDILPVTVHTGVDALPHFPQLKVSVESQPGYSLPEKVPVGRICLIRETIGDQQPGLQLLPRGKAVQVLAGHTAGARLFDQRLLAAHLAFAAEAARLVPVYELTYPRRFSALEEVRKILETPC